MSFTAKLSGKKKQQKNTKLPWREYIIHRYFRS